MKKQPWRWLGRAPRWLTAPRLEPVQHARRILAIQRNIVLPAKFVVILCVFYYLYLSRWTGEFATTYQVVFETMQRLFVAYVVLNLAVAAVLFLLRRSSPGFLQWIVFAVGLVDGLLFAGLALLTGGFDSILYWILPGMIVLNAISIPLATPQIVLNLALSVFYLGAGSFEWSLRDSGTAELYVPPRAERKMFSTGDIRDVPSLVAKLKRHTDPVSQFLWDQISAGAREKVSAFTEESTETRSLQVTLAGEMNRIIQKGSIYSQPRFAGVALSAETQSLLKQDLQGERLSRLNRLLLEDAYPSEIAQSPEKSIQALRYVMIPAASAESVENPAEPYVLRLTVLLLFTACCYGVQVLASRQELAEEEQKEFIARTEQLRAAGRLAAEFAHQIKNPLAIINNAAFSLQRALKQGRTDVGEQIQIIQEEVQRSDQIVTQIMGYAQLSESRVEKLNVIEELDRAIEQVFPPAVDDEIKVERQYASSFPPLLMQRRHLADILINLLQNAREALRGAGNIAVTAACRADYTIEVTIGDDGPGIPPDKLERIFEPYYTTKERGTGLGLAIVKHNVELYAGTVRVESELGKGTRFVLKFPAKTVIHFPKQK